MYAFVDLENLVEVTTDLEDFKGHAVRGTNASLVLFTLDYVTETSGYG